MKKNKYHNSQRGEIAVSIMIIMAGLVFISAIAAPPHPRQIVEVCERTHPNQLWPVCRMEAR